MGRATEKTDLAFCTSYKGETSADGEQSVQNMSELEAIALKSCQMKCVKYNRGRTCLSAGTCQLLCSWRYKCENVSMFRICDVSHAADHVVRFTRPSGSVFHTAKTGAGESLGTRLSTRVSLHLETRTTL